MVCRVAMVVTFMITLGVTACMPSRTAAQPATDADLQRQLSVPAGLKVQYFARLPGARWMVLGTDGSVYVSVPGRGTVVRLYAFNRAGIPDSQTVIAEGLNEPHGMAFHKHAFYVANNDGVVRFGLDARGIPAGRVAIPISWRAGLGVVKAVSPPFIYIDEIAARKRGLTKEQAEENLVGADEDGWHDSRSVDLHSQRRVQQRFE